MKYTIKKGMLLLGLFILPFVVKAQEKVVISGVVVDERGETIIGANIALLGSTFSTITDIDGKFSLKAVPGSDLKVSCIGFMPKVVKATEKPLKVILSEDAHQLKEAVAIGYGTVKRENLLGAVSSLNAAEIEDIPAGNLSQTLVGKLAAVHVSETTGRPGSTTPLTIRTSGSFSTGSAEPIFVIDGIIRSQDAFDLLDPNDVESFSILKDAAAAVYGSRGAGGAVVVTMKKGKEGKAKISYSGQYGATQPTSFPNMLTAYEQATLINQSLSYDKSGIKKDLLSQNASYTDDELEAFKSLDYNWVDAAWQNSSQLRHNMSISGGSNKVTYYASGSMWTESGNFDKIDVKKYTLRTSLQAEVSKSVSASLELAMDNNNEKFPYLVGDNEENMNGFYKTLLSTPRWIPYKVGERYVVNTINTTQNPLGLLNSQSYRSSLDRGSRINASLNYKPDWFKGLTGMLRLGYNTGSSSSRQYVSPYKIWKFGYMGLHNHIIDQNNPLDYTIANSSNERLTLAYGISSSYQLNAQLSYLRKFGDHNLDIMFSYEQSESTGNGSSIRAIDQQIPGLERLEAFDGIDIYSSNISNSGRLGFIGRLNYNYKEKYLMEATFREEASVKFDKNNRWGFFPAVALGWRVSEENFYKDNVTWMDYLKLRASAGLMGQDNGVSNYEYKFSYNLSSAAYFGNGAETGMENGLSVLKNGIVTSGVTWEKTSSYNVGVDTKFLGNRFDLSLDGYWRHTWDIFDNIDVLFTDLVGTTGSSIPKVNYGVVNSWGFDVELGYNGTISENTNYYLKGNLSWGDNVIVKKNQDPKWKNTYAWQEGHSTNVGDYGFKTSGIFRTQEQVDAYMTEHPGMTYFTDYKPAVGSLIFEDVARAGDATLGEPYYVNEPDGKVDDYDLVPLYKKSGTPFAFGVSTGLSYKTFRVDMTFTGGFGGYEIMNKVERVGPTATLNVPNYWKDSWSETNTDAKYPNVAYGTNAQPSSFWVRPSDILRLRTINFSYNMPKEWCSRIGIPSIRIFATSTNLLTLWSAYDFKDANLARYYDYPILRSFNLGLNLSL